MSDPGAAPAPPPASGRAVGNPYVAAVAAWLLPGAGHLLLKRRGRALLFFLLILASLVIGCQLRGNLYQVVPGQPLTILATIGTMGVGIPYFILRSVFHYQGDVIGAGYEYGTAFLVTAGLMNLLLVLDAWDIALGKKE